MTDAPPTKATSDLPGQHLLDRRRFLELTGATLAAPVVGGLAGTIAATPALAQVSGARWDQKTSWPNGKVPGANDIAVVNRRVVLSGSATVAGVQIEPGGELVFDPNSSATLTSTGNITVAGRLTMRPAAVTTQHRISFTKVDERRYKGGHAHMPLATDVGLWITGSGVLDAAGAAKEPWTRATASLRKGQTEFYVQSAAGWRVGDRVVITPTGAPTLDNGSFNQDVQNATLYDEGQITSISGNRVRISKALVYDHPMIEVTDADGYRHSYGAEVLNLTRNVVIEGQPNGRAHVQFLMTTRPQALSHIEIRHMGPRQGSGKNTAHLVGRYGLHFHHCGDGSRGTVVEGVVVHSGGAQGFVPHCSHGITLRRCVAHDVMAGGFWWDGPDASGAKQLTHDCLWDRCVASKVTSAVGGNEGYRMAGFTLGPGEHDSNSVLGCVAVGVARDKVTMNTSTPSGFHWPEQAKARWRMEGCLAHNNGGSGLFSWITNEEIHEIEGFTAYHNSRYGIDHGGYSNNWQFRDCVLYGNRLGGIGCHAVSRRTNATSFDAPLLTFERMAIDGAGISTYGLTGEQHTLPAEFGAPVVLKDSTIRRVRVAGVNVPQQSVREEYLVQDCYIDAREYWIDTLSDFWSHIEVVNHNRTGQYLFLRRRGYPFGVTEMKWNAVIV